MTGRFLQIKCTKCNNEQNIYEKASNNIKCLVCNEQLAETTGAVLKFNEKAEILKAL